MTIMDQKVAELSQELIDMGEDLADRVESYTLADAIRQGCMVSKQAFGEFGNGENACALQAALIAAEVHGLV